MNNDKEKKLVILFLQGASLREISESLDLNLVAVQELLKRPDISKIIKDKQKDIENLTEIIDIRMKAKSVLKMDGALDGGYGSEREYDAAKTIYKTRATRETVKDVADLMRSSREELERGSEVDRKVLPDS